VGGTDPVQVGEDRQPKSFIQILDRHDSLYSARRKIRKPDKWLGHLANGLPEMRATVTRGGYGLVQKAEIRRLRRSMSGGRLLGPARKNFARYLDYPRLLDKY
jgi:hypothetical protein